MPRLSRAVLFPGGVWLGSLGVHLGVVFAAQWMLDGTMPPSMQTTLDTPLSITWLELSSELPVPSPAVIPPVIPLQTAVRHPGTPLASEPAASLMSAEIPSRPALNPKSVPISAQRQVSDSERALDLPGYVSEQNPQRSLAVGTDSDIQTLKTALVPSVVPASQADGPDVARKAQPDYMHNPAPEYPRLLREQGLGGTVWLKVWVDAEGHPADIRLLKGSGYRLLDDAALSAVRQWRFLPARTGEQSHASWVEFPIQFSIRG